MARQIANPPASETGSAQSSQTPATPKAALRPQALQRLQTLIWVLIYGGLLALVLGIATRRAGDDAVGWGLAIGGGVAAAVGVLLIGVRAQLQSTDGR